MTLNRQIILASRPDGAASADNFKLQEAPLPPLAEGEVRVRHHYLSLDPYMRGRMNDSKSYTAPQALGEPMGGGTVGEVVESRFEGLAPGDRVLGHGGWQEWSQLPGKAWTKLPTDDAVPLSYYLGAVGMPGVTAWVGLNEIIQPKAGDTVLVSAASGAVGSAFAALAKARGCHTVGIAGGPEKCAYAEQELGFDVCVDYRPHADAQSLSKALKAVCPNGVEGYFENVGGMIMNAVLPRMNAFGRIALCGLIAGYDGAPTAIDNPSLFLIQRLKMQGFIVSEFPKSWAPALKELGDLVKAGKLRPRETVAQGLEHAPEAFFGMLKGKNFGKQLVKLI
ncbi:NADP-dependent oxidoreductase [Comamonas serinivorans]|uniref:NADP-dependent oxidoreductase n=1 Tax=Comamonas serinivorans TaxID=1082851 RepID=A0A1Y0ENZ4_9BURK|nr:NADP-dependent oxidoreductase [Comamonas serinivorans]ARU05170.1 NADP-dependent oxidoreductase [Comamonas serinivorans]